jgi:hypothetical protein
MLKLLILNMSSTLTAVPWDTVSALLHGTGTGATRRLELDFRRKGRCKA